MTGDVSTPLRIHVSAGAGACVVCGEVCTDVAARDVPLRSRVCDDCWARARAEPAPPTDVQLELPVKVAGRDRWRPRVTPRRWEPAPCSHIGGLVELEPVARSTRRKLPGDAVGRVAQLAMPIDLHDGRVAFEAGPGAYAALPAWHSRGAWLGALKVHPRLLEACARLVKPPLFLEIMRELSGHADPATGRDIAVVHADVAVAIGVCTKTVQRACTIGYRLGALHLVAEGGEMAINQRAAVLAHYDRGQPRRRWRKLPNFYAAVMPAHLAALAAPAPAKAAAAQARQTAQGVDGEPGSKIVVHLPVGVPAAQFSSVDLNSRRPFTPACGQPAPLRNEQHPRRTAAARPTERHQRTVRRPGPVIEPELDADVTALSALLPGYHGLSTRRVGPALRRYLCGGLSPAELVAGLNTYLRVAGLTWLTVWNTRDPAQRTEQARYLVGMLTRARLAGHLIPDPWPAD